ncbi:MAG TPA: MMPL family transporter, partial [Polyangiaceae bacterium LLY-WYZ-14_1]|nr:MMPL family transporter [Polyangiaceae bacterium LLY-WYZ-14_1]
MRRLPSVLAGLVGRRPLVVLIGLGLATAGLAAAIPQLRADPSPRSLVAALEGHQATEARFAERFGEVGRVVLLMVSSERLLTEESLGYVHALSTGLEEALGDRVVARVLGPTTTPLARRGGPDGARDADETGLTLDDLDAGGDGDGDGLTLDDLDAPAEAADGLTLDDLDAPAEAADELTLDDLGSEGDGDDGPPGIEDLDPETLDAVGGIVRAEPARFPMGLASLSNAAAEIDRGPLVAPEAEVGPEDVARARAAFDGPTLLDRRLISPDRTVAGVAVFLSEAVDDFPAERKAVAAIQGWLDDHPPPDGAEVQLAGLPYLHVSIVEKMVADQARLIPLTVLICLVVLWLSFRWLPAVALSLAAVLATTAWVLGGMAIVGEKITLLNNILPALLIIIGISYSIHLLGRYREQLRRGQDRDQAIRTTVLAMAV